MSENVNQQSLPSHIAYIMDGNGRWAISRGLPRAAGHRAGVSAFKRVLTRTVERGVGVITFYVFSTENWKRPRHEVMALMGLLYEYLEREKEELMKMRVRFHVMGDLAPLSRRVKRKILEVENYTSGNPYLLNFALNYGGRDEIVAAVNRLISEGKTEVTKEDIDSALYTAGCPDPDLVVRTSGELRLSNFLTWQTAYSELYFTNTLWPDMTAADVDLAIDAYSKRKRRFGGA